MYSFEQVVKGLQQPAIAKREIYRQWQRITSIFPHDIGVQGSYCTGNIGDQAIGSTFSEQLSEMGYQPRTFGKNIQYSRASVHILGGGGVLHDWYGTDHLRRRLNFISDKGAIIGVGVPGFKTDEGRALIQSGLSNVDLITVRDKWSQERLSPHYDGDIHVTACPTLIRSNPDVPTTGRTGVNFRRWFHLDPAVMSFYFDYNNKININEAKEKYIQNINRICDEIDNPIFIPFHKDDEQFAHECLDIEILPYESSVKKTLKRVSSVDQMVATRYHSLVFAIICETPTLAIAYEPKVSSLADRVGISSYNPHRSIPVEFEPISNRQKIKRSAKNNFYFLREYLTNNAINSDSQINEF